MNRNAVALALGLLAAFAAMAIVLFARDAPLPIAATEAIDPAYYFDQGAAMEDRILALEAAVAQERNARLLLEEELQVLYEQIEELESTEGSTVEDRVAEFRDNPERIREARTRSAAGQSDRNLNRLIEAGFSPDRAEWLLKRESELQMQQMQMMFEARQSGERIDRNDVRLDPDQALRTEIGDAEYERYLQAYGRSTSVAVGTVLESSPGQIAGLQSGDEIVAYGGQRVFSYSELSQQTMRAQAGQSVVVDIVRDGVPMQVVVEAGPIGISNQGFRGRR
jgi:predicted metalloprotease with PDZ domain